MQYRLLCGDVGTKLCHSTQVPGNVRLCLRASLKVSGFFTEEQQKFLEFWGFLHRKHLSTYSIQPSPVGIGSLRVKAPTCNFGLHRSRSHSAYPPPRFPTLLSPAALIYPPCISCKRGTPPPLIVMCRIRHKRTFSGAFSQSVEISFPCNCCQFGSNKLIKIL